MSATVRRRKLLLSAFVFVAVFSFASGVAIRDWTQDGREAEFVKQMHRASIACNRYNMTLVYDEGDFGCARLVPVWTGKAMRRPVDIKGKR